MSFIKVRWKHSHQNEPVLLYSELNDERIEVRKVEVFADGHCGFASAEEESGGSALGLEPVPSLAEIASDPQFDPVATSRDEFEGVWAKRHGLGPFRLAPWFSPRPWGRRDLRPWYSETGMTVPVGEAWLTGPESVVETGPMAGRTLAAVAAEAGEALLGVGGGVEFPLLVKLLFPNDKLSVQVHPDDEQAHAMGQTRGKTECWYVLEAEPRGTIGLGLKAGATADAVRAAIAAGTLEELMEWVPVEVGDMIFVDAGTVHAIGPGVVLLETQQTSDITFRMYDYGRPRELHVEQALQVMKTKTAAGKVAAVKMDGFTRLIEQKYFVVDRYDIAADSNAVIPIRGASCLVGLSGPPAMVQAEGQEALFLTTGRAVVVPAGCGHVMVATSEATSYVHCFAPAR